MVPEVQSCPIWDIRGDGFAGTYINQTRVFRVDYSRRAGGAYTIPEVIVASDIGSMTQVEKARLTTWLVDQRKLGNLIPDITHEVIQHAKSRRPLPVDDRANRLLRLIALYIDQVGKKLSASSQDLDFFAWTESLEWGEVSYLWRFLVDAGLATARIGPDSIYNCEITVAGYKHIADQATNPDSSQAFVAMWFDQSMVDTYKQGIAPAIRNAGFQPLRIDQEEYINKIDDEVIAEIRRSRFVVADFTQDGDNARGGVYYEAGFAQGLGLPVVFTCREDCIGRVHFDTNHYNHIVWTEPDELRRMLTHRIVGVLGEGPLMNQ